MRQLDAEEEDAYEDKEETASEEENGRVPEDQYAQPEAI